MLSSVMMTACVKDDSSISAKAEETAAYLEKTVTDPQVASIGGEWTIKGIAESGYEPEDGYYDLYYDNVRARIKSSDGILHDRYYTEYARVTIGLNAIGKDPENVEGYNLISYLDDEEKILTQGTNAASYSTR